MATGVAGNAFADATLKIDSVPGKIHSFKRPAINYKSIKRPVFKVKLTHPDGTFNKEAMISMLERLPTFRENMKVLKPMLDSGRLQFFTQSRGAKGGPANIMYTMELPEGVMGVVAKAEAHDHFKTGDLLKFYMHELVHVADHTRLSKLIIKRANAFPDALLSKEKRHIRSGRTQELPGGYFIDRNLWLYMLEQRAYWDMNRQHNALRRNAFSDIKFSGTDHLRSITRRLHKNPSEKYGVYQKIGPLQMAMADANTFSARFPRATTSLVMKHLRNKGFSKQEIDGLGLSPKKKLSPVTTFILAKYLSNDVDHDDPKIDISAPLLSSYCTLSVKQILSGEIKKNAGKKIAPIGAELIP